MGTPETLKYIIEDRAIAEMLGRQNFSNKISAILELVKNSYDAFAKKLEIKFLEDSIELIDDGIGMNESDIKNRWMHVGYSEKLGQYDIEINNEKRILSGSKGVGRFALSRLGNNVCIVSKKSGYDTVVWCTDWDTCQLETSKKECIGTRIIIKDLRDKWNNKDLDELIKYLGKVYFDDKMEIHIITTSYENQVIKTNDNVIQRYYARELTVHNYTSNIKFNFNSSTSKLKISVLSDEFTEEAKKYYKENNLNSFDKEFDMYEELKKDYTHFSNEEYISLLKQLGSFFGVFYFSNNANNQDCEKFCYKKDKDYILDSGIVLYRNSFSISSYEGKRDWLELGKRSRKSPAAATHTSGAWRVRENQLSGYVMIDKNNNSKIKEMSNRQGLEEDDYYHLFIDIIHFALSCFERYRQNIIRAIDVKNKVDKEINEGHYISILEKQPSAIKQMSVSELEKVSEEIKEIKNTNKKIIDDSKKTEEKYRYDFRILNSLSTLGLKASSIAHELQNDRNMIASNFDKIIKRMKELGVWETVDNPDNKKKAYQDIPNMLDSYKRINNKMLNFMDIMMNNIEKSHFDENNYDLKDLISEICDNWKRQYASLNFTIVSDKDFIISISYDIINVIFDNLILNSIQQNDKQSILNINIYISEYDNKILVEYRDDGRGLVKKYLDDPMRILEVHESSRTNGHGLGMWIVNNSLQSLDGKVMNIDGHNGFSISFLIGGKYNV